MTFMPSLSEDATVVDVFAKFPDLYAAMAAFSEAAFRGDGPLSTADRQVLFTFVARPNASTFSTRRRGRAEPPSRGA